MHVKFTSYSIISVFVLITNLSLWINGQASLTSPHLPSSTHTQCEACTRSGPGQAAPCLSENKPALSTRHSWKEEFLYGDSGLLPFLTSQPILCISLSPALWGDIARKELAGTGQGNKFLKKETGAQQYISIDCKHKSLLH